MSSETVADARTALVAALQDATATGTVSEAATLSVTGALAPQPPSPQSVQAAADALTQRKKEFNDKWLKSLGQHVWVAVSVVAVVSLGFAFVRNDTPNATHRIDTASSRITDALTDAAGIVKGKSGVLGSEDATAVSADASAIGDAAATITNDVPKLPRTWSGDDVSAKKRAMSDAATALTTDAAQLDSTATTSDAGELGSLVAKMTATNDAIHRHRVSGLVGPWSFTRPAAQGVVYAIVLTLVVLASMSLLTRASGGLRQFLIGGDGRFSTAQTQAAIWTVALFFLLANLLLRRTPGKFDQLDDTYLLLLGGPYAAWVIGGAIGRGKLTNQDVQKVAAPESQVRDLVCDDDGRANLTDAQFFFFSMLALVGVFVAFAQDPTQLPKIPSGLALLSTAGALVYTGKKAADSNAPSIFSVTRADTGPIVAGTTIRIRGQNFLPPGSAGDLDVLTAVTVRFKSGTVSLDQRVVPQVNGTVGSAQQAHTAVTNISDGEITIDVPNLPAGPATVAVIPASGTATQDYQITVAPPVMITSVEQPTNTTVQIRGVRFAPDGDTTHTTLAIGTSTAVHMTSIKDDVIVATLPPNLTGATEVKVTNLVGSDTRTFTVKPPPPPPPPTAAAQKATTSRRRTPAP